MTGRVPIACPCGTVTGHVEQIGQGTHLQCFCSECRASEVFAGQPDPGDAPVELFQTLPHRLFFATGQDQLRVFSLGPKKVLRWQVACCGAILGNTLRTPRLPLISLRANWITDKGALGPVLGRAFVPQPDGKQKTENMRRIVWRFMRGAALARLTGKWRRTPFFDKAGKPVAPVHVLTSAELARLPLRAHATSAD